MKILFIIDPIEKLFPATDTSLALMKEAGSRGHEVFSVTISDLFANISGVFAKLTDDPGAQKPLAAFDVIFMRKDPPFDIEYIFATHLLSLVDRTRTLIINNPDALRSFNEKLSVLLFPDLAPKSLVTKQNNLIKKFIQDNGEAVLKPLDRAGGYGVFHVQNGDKNIPSLIEILTNEGQRHIMAQEYVPEGINGDKRILLLGGEILGAVARKPAPEDHRGNIHSGAVAERTKITDGDRGICERLAPWLRENGLIFVGIDVIGNFLTEINVTSPTCVIEINVLEKTRLETRIIDWIEHEKIS